MRNLFSILCCPKYQDLIAINTLLSEISIDIDTMNTDITPPEGKKCFSGIPEAHFIDDVDSHMKGDDSAEAKIKKLDESHQKYKFMEGSLVARRKRLKTQVPDIKSSLAMIKKLREKKSAGDAMETQFLLSDQV